MSPRTLSYVWVIYHPAKHESDSLVFYKNGGHFNSKYVVKETTLIILPVIKWQQLLHSYITQFLLLQVVYFSVWVKRATSSNLKTKQTPCGLL